MPRCESCFGPVTAGTLCAVCSTLDRSDLALPLGARLQHGRYLIGRTLGDPGGFGVTYLAWDASLERQVAIKEYFPRHLVSRAGGNSNPTPTGGSSAADFDSGLRGFLDEARRLAKLDHPDIVKVHDYCEANGTGYLVMSYYEGHDLRGHVEQAGGTLDWQEAVSIALPLLDGLGEVHRAGLIHRDIKPANVYLATLADATLRPILIDFGAARWASTTHELTAILTEGFAPLEQYPGCGPQGPYTDVYATAATLYAVISGRIPASAPSRLTHAYVAHLTDQVPGVPRRLGDVIEQAMSIQAEDRPQSAAEFARAVRTASGAVTSRLIAAAPPSRDATPAPAPAGFVPPGRAPVSHDTPTVPATVVDAAGVPTEHLPAGRSALALKRGALIGYAVAAVAVVVAVGAYLMSDSGSVNGSAGDPAAPVGSQASPVSGPQAVNLEPEAARHSTDGRAALDAGDYAKAMAAASALHTLSLRTDASAESRLAWAQWADSIAGVVTSACPMERALLLKRDPNTPQCPARGW